MSSNELDVSGLPSFAFGSRGTPWWGAVALIAIEGTGFALLLGTYLYLRGNADVWPPEGVRTPDLVYPVIGTALLLTSLLPTRWSNQAALEQNLAKVQFWLIGATLPVIGLCILRWLEFRSLPFTWYNHAYGSVFWTVLGLHTVHAVAALCENFYVAFVVLKPPVEERRLVDVRAGNLYFYFMVLSWLPFFVLFYGERLK